MITPPIIPTRRGRRERTLILFALTIGPIFVGMGVGVLLRNALKKSSFAQRRHLTILLGAVVTLALICWPIRRRAGCALKITVAGRWSAPTPRRIARLWLAWVFVPIVQKLRNDLLAFALSRRQELIPIRPDCR